MGEHDRAVRNFPDEFAGVTVVIAGAPRLLPYQADQRNELQPGDQQQHDQQTGDREAISSYETYPSAEWGAFTRFAGPVAFPRFCGRSAFTRFPGPLLPRLRQNGLA